MSNSNELNKIQDTTEVVEQIDSQNIITKNLPCEEEIGTQNGTQNKQITQNQTIDKDNPKGFPLWLNPTPKTSIAEAYNKIHASYKRFKIIVPEGVITGSPYVHCPECLSTRKNKEQPSLQIHIMDGSWICHHCGYCGDVHVGMARKKNPTLWLPLHWRKPSLPLKENLTPKMISWFKARGISTQTLERHHICAGNAYIPAKEAISPCMLFPYFINGVPVNVKIRDSKKNLHLEKGCEPTFYALENINQDATIITEEELDTLSLEEAGFLNTIGIPYVPTSKTEAYEDNFEYLLNAEEQLQNIKKIYLAFSNTEAGRKAEEELARRLGKERCWQVRWNPDRTDANDVLIKDGKEAIITAINNAKAYPIKGIFEASDVYERIDTLYYYGLPRGALTGWPTLDEHYTVKEGQWTLVTGIPGHGKSNFLDAMLVNVAEHQKWRFGMFSPENQPIERHFANLMEKYADAPFSFGPTERMSVEQRDQAKLWVNEHFYVILPDDEEGNWSIDGILALAKALVFRKGIKGLVIDPWNELDHTRQSGLSETEHVSQALTKIRQFARSHGVHIWVVAHPAKLYKDADGKYPVPTPYDVAGSAHWNNKADNALSVWRNRGGKDEEVSDVHIQKIRFKEVGRVGRVSLRYDKRTGRFIDDIDQAKREQALEKMQELPTAELRIFGAKK